MKTENQNSFAVTYNRKLSNLESQSNFGMFEATQTVVIENAQLFALAGMPVIKTVSNKIWDIVHTHKKGTLEEVTDNIASQIKDLGITVDASVIIAEYNDRIEEMEKERIEKQKLKEQENKDCAFLEKITLTDGYSKSWDNILYKGRVVLKKETTYEQMYNDFNAGKHLTQVAKIDAEEAAKKQLPVKVKQWIKENGSELASLRVKHNFEFMKLAGKEHAVQIIAQHPQFQDFKVLSQEGYDQLYATGSDFAPSLNMLKDLDAVYDHPLVVDSLFLEDEGNYYLVLKIQVVSEVNIYIGKKY